VESVVDHVRAGAGSGGEAVLTSRAVSP
jgi:hypothetical protein